jgi:hypothetical protein
MLPASGLPLPSRNGSGLPGLKSSKTPRRTITAASKTAITIIVTRPALRANVRTDGARSLPSVIRPPRLTVELSGHEAALTPFSSV